MFFSWAAAGGFEQTELVDKAGFLGGKPRFLVSRFGRQPVEPTAYRQQCNVGPYVNREILGIGMLFAHLSGLLLANVQPNLLGLASVPANEVISFVAGQRQKTTDDLGVIIVGYHM